MNFSVHLRNLSLKLLQLMQANSNKDEDSDEDEAPEITHWEAIGWLAILTIWVSILSGYLVDAIQVKSIIMLICNIIDGKIALLSSFPLSLSLFN